MPRVIPIAIASAIVLAMTTPAGAVVRPAPAPSISITPDPDVSPTVIPTAAPDTRVAIEYNAYQGVKHRDGKVLMGSSNKTTVSSTTVDSGWINNRLTGPAATTQKAIDFMVAVVGKKPYQRGGTGHPGYDCSGLVQAAFKSAGVALPRTSAAQFAATQRVPNSELQPGDLLFFGPGGSWHVAVYLGGTQLVHAATPSIGIEISDMTYAWYATNFYGAGRVIVR